MTLMRKGSGRGRTSWKVTCRAQRTRETLRTAVARSRIGFSGIFQSLERTKGMAGRKHQRPACQLSQLG